MDSLMTQLQNTRVQRAVAEHFGISIEQLLGSARQFVIARHIAMYLEYEVSQKSFPKIGREYGRDHSTIVAARNHVAARLEANDDRYAAVTALRAQLEDEQLEQALEKRSHRSGQIYCPTCGSLVVQELRNQIAALETRLDMIQRGM